VDINESGNDKVVFSSYTGAVGYGCNFSISEITFKSITKLLYFKIRYELKERLKQWKNSEILLRILSMIKTGSGWRRL